jgi:DNA-binding transcriptional MerR regulator
VNDVTGQGTLFTIGQLARRTGVSVRTIRFWSDGGIVPATDRSDGGYRLYDAEAVARIDLVRTLRELGLGLEAIAALLRQQTSVREVARAHVEALDAEIRTLRLRRAVLRTVAKRTSTVEEMKLMHKLAKLSAAERQQIIDRFVDQAFSGIPADAPGTQIAKSMRQMPAELPDDPTTEQVDAWVELAELVQDASFAARVREMALAGAAGDKAALQEPIDPKPVTEHAGAAVKAGVDPASADGKAVLDRIVPPDTPPEKRAAILKALETFSDRRVERYWQLLGIINGWPTFEPSVPAFEWVIAALKAHG